MWGDATGGASVAAEGPVRRPHPRSVLRSATFEGLDLDADGARELQRLSDRLIERRRALPLAPPEALAALLARR